jgi:hypothetical protein
LIHQKHIREKQEIAHAFHHPFCLGFANAGDHFIALESQRSIAGIGNFRPDHHMAIAQVITAILELQQSFAVNTLDIVFFSPFHLPSAQYLHVIGVYCRKMITIDAIFGLQFPVALGGICRITFEYLQAFS